MDIDAVEQWTGDALAVALYLERSAAALTFRVSMEAARARIETRLTSARTQNCVTLRILCADYSLRVACWQRSEDGVAFRHPSGWYRSIVEGD